MENFIEKTPWKDDFEVKQSKFITKVYAWMCLALIVTGLTSMWVVNTPEVLQLVTMSRYSMWVLFGLELATVWYITSVLDRISASKAMLLFMAFAIINGLSLSVIFLLFTAQSIMSTFLIAAGMFAVMSTYGYFTKNDLTKLGNLLMMAVIGLIIASLVNFFLESSMMHFIISCVGVIVFTGLIAYDTQKIKEMFYIAQQDPETKDKIAIFGALNLYLDFINLFTYLLNLTGDRD